MRASVLLLLLAGCAGGHHVYLPDGSRGRMVACSGSDEDWGDCMNRAHRLCDGRYRIVERYADRSGAPLAAHGASRDTWAAGRDRKMLISCGP